MQQFIQLLRCMIEDADQACGSLSLSLAVTIIPLMKAKRCPLRLEPANMSSGARLGGQITTEAGRCALL